MFVCTIVCVQNTVFYISQSGSVLAPLQLHSDLDAQRQIAYTIGDKVGCSEASTQQLMACLRKVDAQILNTAVAQVFLFTYKLTLHETLTLF